jgi:hypothetical protein
VAIWIYTLVFAFSSLWFTHYCLAALAELRAVPVPVVAPEEAPVRRLEVNEVNPSEGPLDG